MLPFPAAEVERIASFLAPLRYDRVYTATRPELFFKATPHRVVASRAKVAIRGDAKWSVPEPELTLLITPSGRITGYTAGNDMSSRDIEGENPLYLPQAKVYDGSCALGPCVLLASEPLPKATTIQLSIQRGGAEVFGGETTLAELKRDPQELAMYLSKKFDPLRKKRNNTGSSSMSFADRAPPGKIARCSRCKREVDRYLYNELCKECHEMEKAMKKKMQGREHGK